MLTRNDLSELSNRRKSQHQVNTMRYEGMMTPIMEEEFSLQSNYSG